ncbi:MAG: metallophosphoesterase [Bacteroidota bacterium]
MKLIQITDLHIGLENEDTRGVDVRHNFIKILEAIENEKPDCLIITGDFCYRAPMLEIYIWVKEQLEKLPFAYYMIPGNHDDTHMMKTVFGIDLLNKKEYFFKKVFAAWNVLFLDTTIARMSDDQYEWLAENIIDDKDQIIFMHHPPAYCDVGYMDSKHAFQEQEKFQSLLKKYNSTFHIFCGHYHVDKVVHTANMHIHITPSLFFQIKQGQIEFEVDHYNVGYRVLKLTSNNISSYVRYI